MGTNAHKPTPPKADWQGKQEDAPQATGPGERRGVPSRIEAARARLKLREK